MTGNSSTSTLETSTTEGEENPNPIEGAKMYIGKHLLSGLTYRDNKSEVIRLIQLHGIITKINTAGIFFDPADGKGEFTLPPDLSSLEPAIPGATYTFKPTGEEVHNVDYISNWTIDAPSDEADDE